jgi:hypothetical protein
MPLHSPETLRIVPAIARPGHLTAHLAAVHRLLDLSQHNTIAGALAADFLLAWWHADVFGRFDLSLADRLDTRTQRDLAAVYDLSTLDRGTPDEIGLTNELEQVALRRYAGRAA